MAGNCEAGEGLAFDRLNPQPFAATRYSGILRYDGSEFVRNTKVAGRAVSKVEQDSLEGTPRQVAGKGLASLHFAMSYDFMTLSPNDFEQLTGKLPRIS